MEKEIHRDYKNEVLKELLPNSRIKYSASYNNIPINIELDGSNESLKGSDYYNEKISNLRFIHFTSVEGFKSIFSTNILRLYDLNFADDPNEMVFASKKADLLFSNKELSLIKSNLYSCSFCKFPFSNDEEEYNLWRIYGRDGKGIGLVFTIDNDYQSWFDFHLSIIYYNELDKLQKLKNAIDRHFEFVKQLLKEKNIDTNKREELLPMEISKLLSFHKQSIFKIENEFRLLFYQRANENPNIKIFSTLNNSNKISGYIELPLHNQNKKSNLEVPCLALKKIILGYRFSNDDKFQIQEDINKVIKGNYKHHLPYRPKITITDLKDNYFK